MAMSSKMRIGLAAAVLGMGLTIGLAIPARADEPGPGGTKAPVPVTGEEIYRDVCQSCHMADGKGASGAATIPALANNPKMGAAAYPLTMVMRGRGAMPWFSDLLTPKQVAAVVGYVRTHFGNDFPKPVTEAEAKAMAGPPIVMAH